MGSHLTATGRHLPYGITVLPCCCHDEPIRQLPIWGDTGTDVPKRWGIRLDSESRGIRLSLVIVDSHFINWGTTQGRLSLPTADILSTIVLSKLDVDGCWQTVKLQSVLRLCSGFYRSKDPTNSITVLKEYSVTCNPTQVNAPALTPASKLVLDLPTPEGWKAELT